MHSGFISLVLIYFVTFAGEGLLIMYLFNSIRVNGLSIGISALLALVSYLPSLVLTGVTLALHTRYSVRARMPLISIARALLCMSLVWTGSYLNIWVTLAFLASMEILWYGLLPCLDELENKTIHSVGAGRGEAILTITLQLALATSLLISGFLFDAYGAPIVLTCLAALQLLPAVLIPQASSIPKLKEGSAQVVSAPKGKKESGIVPLVFLLGVVSAIPQMVNILFPIKVFVVTDRSALAGVIDASYSVGALGVAVIGLGALLHSSSVRSTAVITMTLVTCSVAGFALSSAPPILVSAYFLLGFTVTLCRVRVRAAIFARLEGIGTSPWYSHLTSITLAFCVTGTILIGLVGLLAGLWSYLVIVVIAIAGIMAGLFIETEKIDQKE